MDKIGMVMVLELGSPEFIRRNRMYSRHVSHNSVQTQQVDSATVTAQN